MKQSATAAFLSKLQLNPMLRQQNQTACCPSNSHHKHAKKEGGQYQLALGFRTSCSRKVFLGSGGRGEGKTRWGEKGLEIRPGRRQEWQPPNTTLSPGPGLKAHKWLGIGWALKQISRFSVLAENRLMCIICKCSISNSLWTVFYILKYDATSKWAHTWAVPTVITRASTKHAAILWKKYIWEFQLAWNLWHTFTAI